MVGRTLRVAVLVATLALALGQEVVVEQRSKQGDSTLSEHKEHEVLVSSLNTGAPGRAAAGAETTRSLLGGGGDRAASEKPSAEEINEKIRAVFSSSKPKDEATPTVTATTTTTATKQLSQPAAEMHGNTRHVMDAQDKTPSPLASSNTPAADKKPESAEGKLAGPAERQTELGGQHNLV